MNVDHYLQRIGYRGSREPSAVMLRDLHRAHLFSVPFENLDIALGRPIELALPSLYAKIVERRRGGFCYEVNGLFAWLLGELGFRRELRAARVFGAESYGPEFDHVLLSVQLEDEWVADVGFGDSFIEPLQVGSLPVHQHGADYRLVCGDAADRILQQRRAPADWLPQYRFAAIPQPLSAFEAMCVYQQTSPQSSFTRKRVCSLATPAGRKTLSNNRYIVSTGATREERPVVDSDDYRRLLLDPFGIEFPTDVDLGRLLA